MVAPTHSQPLAACSLLMQALSEEDANLIKIFNRMSDRTLPTGTPSQIAEEIRNWIAVQNFDTITKLDLSDLDLTAVPPEIGYLRHLEELDLSNNRITNLANVNLPELTTLLASNNRIASLADTHLGDNLETLDLEGNQLENIDTLLPVSLLSVYLNNNQLVSINQVLGLSCDCAVYASGNAFPIEYLTRFQQMHDSRRICDSFHCPQIIFSDEMKLLPSLRGQLNIWLGAYQLESHCNANFSPLLDLDDAAQQMLNRYLDHFWESLDNEEENQNAGMILRIGDMLKHMSEDEDFRNQMMDRIRQLKF